MPDKMHVQPFEVLLNWILTEYEQRGSIFGIPRTLFYVPQPDQPYAGELFGSRLATPVGPAAGPHTQLAQNIVCAWLSGGRFIELKTVQWMDELEIPRPCIDMRDEGYNVEWSQELKLEQSAGEYIKAWVLLHVLHRLLGFEGRVPVGTILNMSVGYTLEGITSPAMTRFMDRLADASSEIEQYQEVLSTCPGLSGIAIPARLANNVTLSTMHGCPPDEIERIACYLLEERGLHTLVKLNPTLLGKRDIDTILHGALGYDQIEVSAAVVEKDLRYEEAIVLIERLKRAARAKDLCFGVKLSNTLAVVNHEGYLPEEEMYLSGRALYPLTINLFHRLAQTFAGELLVSFSAGADALNVAAILAAGASTVTAASDLLKPGGYSQMLQYVENIGAAMRERGVESLEALAMDKLSNLERAAVQALQDPRYKKGYVAPDLPKVPSGLDLFDCIAAPCMAQCAVCQDVPGYAGLIARGQDDLALATILSRNPLPGVTGAICTQLCQTRCARSSIDQPVAIRALKRFAAARGRVDISASAPTGHRVAVIGSGPSGLAAAFYLAANGVQVTILETRDVAGGILALAPSFRLAPSAVKADIARIEALGVEIKLSHPVHTPPEELLAAGYDAVYVATGFGPDAGLDMEGLEGPGVWPALDLLARVAAGERPDLAAPVLVIGGGNTAIDAARTAQRLIGQPAAVIYRRTRAEMPAEAEEVAELLAEGNVLHELVSPRRVVREGGRVVGLICVRNRLGEPGTDGRREPLPIADSEFQVPAGAIILAVGQRPDPPFLAGSAIASKSGRIVIDPASGRTGVEGVYAGGDAVRGPASIVQACADGRRAAEAICARLGIPFAVPGVAALPPELPSMAQLKGVRARKAPRQELDLLPVSERDRFELVEGTLSEAAARKEAARCLQCATLCDRCVEVCPNRANVVGFVPTIDCTLPRLACQDGALIVVGEGRFQVTQERQILHVDDLCNECGNCVPFCIHNGKPYLDKPRLFLRWDDFEQEADRAFYVRDETIWRRTAGATFRLTRIDEGWSFESDHLRLRLTAGLAVEEMRLKKAFAGVWPVQEAAEMAWVWYAVRSAWPALAGAGQEQEP